MAFVLDVTHIDTKFAPYVSIAQTILLPGQEM